MQLSIRRTSGAGRFAQLKQSDQAYILTTLGAIHPDSCGFLRANKVLSKSCRLQAVPPSLSFLFLVSPPYQRRIQRSRTVSYRDKMFFTYSSRTSVPSILAYPLTFPPHVDSSPSHLSHRPLPCSVPDHCFHPQPPPPSHPQTHGSL